MDILSFDAIKLIIGSSGLLGLGIVASVLILRTVKIIQKFETMDQKLVDLEKKMIEGFKRHDEQLKMAEARYQRLEENILPMNIAITRLEVRLEERSLRIFELPKKEKATSETPKGFDILTHS